MDARKNKIPPKKFTDDDTNAIKCCHQGAFTSTNVGDTSYSSQQNAAPDSHVYSVSNPHQIEMVLRLSRGRTNAFVGPQIHSPQIIGEKNTCELQSA